MLQLRRLRKLHGLTQKQLADTAGVDQSTISKAETGWDGITLRNMQYLASALGIETYELLTDDRDQVEAKLVQIFRSLSPDRQQGWMDMANSLSQIEDQ